MCDTADEPPLKKELNSLSRGCVCVRGREREGEGEREKEREG